MEEMENGNSSGHAVEKGGKKKATEIGKRGRGDQVGLCVSVCVLVGPLHIGRLARWCGGRGGSGSRTPATYGCLQSADACLLQCSGRGLSLPTPNS